MICVRIKFLCQFKCPDFKKYDGKSCLFVHFKIHGVAIAQYGNNDKLLVQTFLRSPIGMP